MDNFLTIWISIHCAKRPKFWPIPIPNFFETNISFLLSCKKLVVFRKKKTIFFSWIDYQNAGLMECKRAEPSSPLDIENIKRYVNQCYFSSNSIYILCPGKHFLEQIWFTFEFVLFPLCPSQESKCCKEYNQCWSFLKSFDSVRLK